MNLRAMAPALLLLLAGCFPWDTEPVEPPGPLVDVQWAPEEAEPIQFGGVERGSSVERLTLVHNGGRLNVNVAGVLGPGAGFLLADEPPVVVEPGETVELPIVYAPQRAEAVAGFLELRTQPALVDPPLLAVRGQGIAAELDWTTLEPLPESAEPGCVQQARLEVENEGTRSATVTAIGWEDVEGFTVVQAPEVPFELDPGASAQVLVEFVREEQGTGIDRVELVTEPEYAATPGPYLEGIAIFLVEAIDTFEHDPSNPVDLLLSEVPWPEGIVVLNGSAPMTDWTYAPNPPRVIPGSNLPAATLTVAYPVPQGC